MDTVIIRASLSPKQALDPAINPKPPYLLSRKPCVVLSWDEIEKLSCLSLGGFRVQGFGVAGFGLGHRSSAPGSNF